MPHHPYISGQAGLVGAFDRLKRGFPAVVDAGYLQRFGIAPSNESYVISILKFLHLIDDDGAQVEANTGYFYGDDAAFKSGLEASLRDAYAQLFGEMGDDALTADKATLAHWFRAADKTTDLVGQRQANTFATLRALAGHESAPPAEKRASPAKKVAPTASAVKRAPAKKTVQPPAGSGSSSGGSQDVGLSVRIEVNLPAGGDAETYDAIFASIRKHLMS